MSKRVRKLLICLVCCMMLTMSLAAWNACQSRHTKSSDKNIDNREIVDSEKNSLFNASDYRGGGNMQGQNESEKVLGAVSERYISGTEKNFSEIKF